MSEEVAKPAEFLEQFRNVMRLMDAAGANAAAMFVRYVSMKENKPEPVIDF
jgi:hypothetical protein